MNDEHDDEHDEHEDDVCDDDDDDQIGNLSEMLDFDCDYKHQKK